MIPQNVKDVVKTALEGRLKTCITEIEGIQSYLDELGYDGSQIVENAMGTEKKEKGMDIDLDGLINNAGEDLPQPLNLVTRQPILKKNHIDRKSCKTSGSMVSKFRGVSKLSNTKWRARLRVAGKDYELGTFPEEIDAARAYDDAKVKLTKSTQGLNIPERYRK